MDPNGGSAANQLASPYGVTVDSAGNLYIADSSNNRIQKWAPGATSGVTVAGGNGSGIGANQLSQPSSVAFDASGNLYVADLYNARIQKFPPGSTSATEGVTVAGGNGTGSGPTQFNFPGNVLIDASGNLLVGDGFNSRVQKFPPGSTSATEGVTVATANGPVGGLALDASANLYVSAVDQVLKFPPGSTSSTVGVTVAGGNGRGAAANQLDSPYSLSFDSGGNLYVTDSGNRRVQKFPPNSTSSSSATTAAGGNGSGPAANQLSNPYGSALDGTGALYVADNSNNRVQKFPVGSTSATDGVTVAGQPANAGSAANQLWFPYGVAVDGSGNLYIADGANNRVQRWAPGATSGTTVAGGTGKGAAANQLDAPSAVAVDGSGRLFVADTGNDRIQVFPKRSSSGDNGTTIAGGNGKGSNANQLNGPLALFLDAAGSVYVSDSTNNRVQKFPPNSSAATPGVTVAGGNGSGSAANQLASPRGVVIDGSGRVYVADLGNARVQRWDANATVGVTIAGTGSGGSAANQLSGPIGLAVDAMGALYVGEFGNNRVQRFPPNSIAGTNATTVASTLSPAGLALDKSGNLYVAEGFNNRVRKWIGTPDAPTLGAVTPSGTTVTIAFTPNEPGGTVPTFTATCSSSNGGVTRSASGTASPITVSTLKAGAAYTCSVKATNAAGSSPSSDASSSFTVVKR